MNGDINFYHHKNSVNLRNLRNSHSYINAEDGGGIGNSSGRDACDVDADSNESLNPFYKSNKLPIINVFSSKQKTYLLWIITPVAARYKIFYKYMFLYCIYCKLSLIFVIAMCLIYCFQFTNKTDLYTYDNNDVLVLLINSIKAL